MSANNSLGDSNGSDSNLASEYALRVALQTIKERCVSLHQRLAIVEEENLAIKTKLCSDSGQYDDSTMRNSKSDNPSELEMLRDKLSKVTKEKLQLSDHIAMVTTENRQLWSRLSQLIKDQNNKQKKSDGEQTSPTGSPQKLIRSETFTQHSPNVLLRPKPIIASSSATKVANNEYSMEDVSLKNFDDYLDEKYGCASKAVSGRAQSTLNFGYLNDDASRLGDFSQDLNSCTTGLQDMKLELKRQQHRMKVLVDLLKERKANPQCTECRKRKEKPETVDKGSVTDECLRENHKASSIVRPDQSKDFDSYDGSAHINILEQKRLADERDKMCPLCGKIYSSAVSFDDFREHVETHFIDDIEVDPNSIETNFEFISHTVGNF